MTIEIPLEEAKALAEWDQAQAMMMPKEALIASMRALAGKLVEILEGNIAERAAAVNLIFWGSECIECGNTTHGTMTCDSCGSDEFTFSLWMPPNA